MDHVRVTANEAGQIIHPSPRNPDFGYIRVEQERQTYEEGWLKDTKISALISGEIHTLKKSNFKKDQILPGKIIIQESLEPFNTKNPEKDYKIAGSTMIVCKRDGKPIYRKTFYTQNPEAQDAFVKHDNKHEIKRAHNTVSENADDHDLTL